MSSKGLILTGFMGVGKSTVGPAAAEKLGIQYYDTDVWMETEFGIDVPALVKSDLGAFRQTEARALADILMQGPGIVSTGGGIVSTEVGRAALQAAIVPVVWLQASFEISAARVTQDTGRERPLFADIHKAQALHAERAQWYDSTARYRVDASQPKAMVIGDIVAIARAVEAVTTIVRR